MALWEFGNSYNTKNNAKVLTVGNQIATKLFEKLFE